MRHQFRRGREARWLSALGATIALAVVTPAAASASSTGAANTPNFDPQNTNIPYLAWNGEQIRLEKCVPADGLTAAEFATFTSPSASFTVEDWSGGGTPQPSVETQSEQLFYSTDFDGGSGGICAEGDVVSLNPGMARIELDVTGFTVPPGTFNYNGPSEPFLAHQFLAGWMTLNTPTLNPMSSSDFGSSNASSINDPTGAGTPDAGTNGAYLDVHVTGTMPIDGPMQNLVGQSSVTLPADWSLLAHALATDNQVDNTTPWDDWDTSGSNQNVTGHVPGACDGTAVSPFAGPAETPDSGAYISPIDNGDNCTGGGADGPFSLGNGGLSAAGTTIGPFDPTNASSTDLADGDLNSLDAPMPAARVDLSIAPNSGSASDISGVGSLVAANKTVTYSRDFRGDSSPSNLYAPFYDAYIPATARPTDDSSGIDGGYANDFPGFLDIDGDGGLYHFWDTLSLGSQTATQTSCLNYSTDNDPQGGAGDSHNVFRSTPSGNDSVAVYTDQNGEAQVQYVPGEGYYFDNLGADMNADGGCDLQGIGTLGTASITATAKYPYKAVDYVNPTSSSVTETVQSLFDKSLSYAPKGTSSDDQLSRIVIAHAQDIDGSPYVGETVCFSVDSNAEGVTRFTGYVNGVYYGGSSSTTDPNGSSLGRTCLVTDGNGNAAIEVLDSNANTVDVIADYTDEGLLRDIPVNFGSSGSTGGSVPTGPVTEPGMSGSSSSTIAPPHGTGTTVPSLAKVRQVSSALARYLTHHRARRTAFDRVMILRLITPTHGAHRLMIRVRSHARTAHLVLTLQVRHGRHTAIVHRRITVRTNRVVKLAIASSVTRVKGARLVG